MNRFKNIEWCRISIFFFTANSIRILDNINVSQNAVTELILTRRHSINWNFEAHLQNRYLQ